MLNKTLMEYSKNFVCTFFYKISEEDKSWFEKEYFDALGKKYARNFFLRLNSKNSHIKKPRKIPEQINQLQFVSLVSLNILILTCLI